MMYRKFSSGLAGWFAGALVLGAAVAATPAPNPFVDALDTPARLSPRALQAPMFALSRVDADRVVAVGPRGHVLRSQDQGRTWAQQPVPVSTDLVAVHFPTATEGWAVGHDGVVLHSRDAGKSWERVLDGRSVGSLMVQAYERRAASGDTTVAKALDDARHIEKEGPSKPFLSVYFRNAQEGWLVGQFNLLLHTVDGGRTWTPWLERTENPESYSLHAIRPVGKQLYIVGELGFVLKLDEAAGIFRRVQTPYPGSWFALTGNDRCVAALGLRGSVWRSCDGGSRWSGVRTGTTGAINGGLVTDDGRLVVVTQQGDILVGGLEAEALARLPRVPGVSSLYDVLQVEPGWLLVAGARGVTRVALPPGLPPAAKP